MSMRILGDYNLIKQIGQGTLGTVFLAEHRFMKKQFVIKILPEELASDRGFIQRFEEEVKILSDLEHPHIVKIHNVSFAQGTYFLVSDCIVDSQGETTNLTQYMLGRGERFSEEELFRLLHQLASALDYAHQRGNIVHRSLKPNNILVGKGNVYLSDFGLSKIIGSGVVINRTYKFVSEAFGLMTPSISAKGYVMNQVDPTKLSMLHQSFLQTFAFLAPEQKKLEKNRVVDFKSDIYAFGILVYFLITRELPEGIFEPLSTFAPGYQLDWDHFVHQCLQSNPDKRPESLVKALESLKTADAPVVETKKPVAAMTVGERIEERIRSELTVTQYRPEIKESKKIEPIPTPMIVIPAGRYVRGSDAGNRDEAPKHYVNVNAFAIDIHPVTNEQFMRFLECIDGEKDSQNHDIIRLRETRIKKMSGKLSVEPGYAKHPVIGVTWYGALAYANWIGKRLPTEAEWEIAARSCLEECVYPTGDDIEKSQANFFSSDTTPVMSYEPNHCGIYDMPGNVYEWCQDWYDFTYYEHSAMEPDNPQGPLQGSYRVLRGGCWKSVKDDLRCAHRHRNNPGTFDRTYGFRCAGDKTEEK